jgi:hypothetical protein
MTPTTHTPSIDVIQPAEDGATIPCAEDPPITCCSAVTDAMLETTRSSVATFGKIAASIAMGTKSHTQYDAEVPKALRTPRRVSKAAATAMLEAVVNKRRHFHNSFVIANFLDETFEIGNITLGELAVAAEVRCERGYTSGEKTIQQALAFSQQPVIAANEGRVEETAAVFVGAYDLFPQQSVEERLDGAFLPILLTPERGHHGLGGQGVFAPKDLHDCRLRLGNGGIR